MDPDSLKALERAVRGPCFWTSDDSLVLLPPHLAGERPEIEEALEREGMRGSLVFATSGSGGDPKRVVLAKRGLAESADRVNAFLDAGAGDRWFLALPVFHVGGASILLRASRLGAAVDVWRERWNPVAAAAAMADAGSTLVSLVPTQLFDLVEAGVPAPAGLRAAVLGGGRLDARLRSRGIALGWPLVETYGMTETASQVAARWVDRADPPADPGLPLLPGWDARVDGRSSAGRLALRGGALLEGYLERPEPGGALRMRDPKVDGWFLTDDHAELRDGCLRGITRIGRVVKVLGELVALDRLGGELGRLPGGDPAREVIVVAVPDARRGSRLVAVIGAETGERSAVVGAAEPGGGGRVAGAVRALRAAVDRFHDRCPGYERISGVAVVPSIPRTPLGKPDFAALERLVTRAWSTGCAGGREKIGEILLENLGGSTTSSGSYGQEILD